MNPRSGWPLRAVLAVAALATAVVAVPTARADGILQQVISRGTVRIAVLGSLPPYSRLTPSGEPEGYDIDIAKRLVDEAQVGLAPGSAFGTGGEGFLRLCFAASSATLRTGVERLVAALA